MIPSTIQDYWVKVIVILFSLAFPLQVFAASPDMGTVIRVHDGDTATVKIGNHIERVRLLGIDAPEIASKGKQKQCYGDEARTALRNAIFKKEVILKRDEHERNRDIYGRLLRYISLKGDEKNIINEQLVREGYTYIYHRSSSPMKKQYTLLEKTAQSAKRGLWNQKTCNGKRYGR